MLAWLAQHWVGFSVSVVIAAAILWWLVKPPSWRDGDGDNHGLVDVGSFRQLH